MNASYYTRAQGVVRGPFTFAQLQTMKSRGQLHRFHEISADRATWVAAGSIVELFGVPSAAIVMSEAPLDSETVLELPGATPIEYMPAPAPRRFPFGWFIGGLTAVAVLAVSGYFAFKWYESRDTASAGPLEADGPAKAIALLREHCHECHGRDSGNLSGSNKRFNVLDRDALIAEVSGKPRSKKYLVPGDPAASALWVRIDNDTMPDGDKKLTSAEKRLLKSWIAAGADFPPGVSEPTVKSGPEVTRFAILQMIFNDLTNLPPEQAAQRRYFVFNHLHNNRDAAKDVKLSHHAALSKLLNSLSKSPAIVVPKALDSNKTVFRINLNDYQWDAAKWNDLLRRYPFGVKEAIVGGKDDKKDMEDRIAESKMKMIGDLTGTPLPFLRGDWFVAQASKPPLYHTLLGIPDKLDDLDKTLGVARLSNIRTFEVKRAGFQKSGVSYANRLIERHRLGAGYPGYYWISYDFKPDNPRANLMAFPLGPKEAGISPAPPEPDLAFEADGGEVVFGLPNGLQGFMLVKADGTRINDGPTDVVKDSKDSAADGNKIVNGLSCFGCHDNGFIRKNDEVRNGSKGISKAARSVVVALYCLDHELKAEFDADQGLFERSLKKCYEGLGVQPSKEPIVACHQEYSRNLNLRKVASELGYDEGEFKKKCEYDAKISARLGVLATKGGTIPRKTWEREFASVVTDLQHGRPLMPGEVR